METKIEKLTQKCELHFIATIEGDEWKNAQQKALVALAQNVTVKGFRKGKAPLAQAARYVNSKDVLDRAADKFVQKAYKEMLENNDVKPVLQPDLIVNDFSTEKFTCTFVVVTAPEVELGEYKGITIEKKQVRVYKADIEAELKAMAEKNAELVVAADDAQANLGDTVVIDFKGFVDGEAFDGGEASSFELVLGSNTFVPGFEEQLVGVKTNEDKEVTITFPENYVANLSNKEARFEVHVNAIKKKVVPAIDDEFVKDLDIEGVETVEKTITSYGSVQMGLLESGLSWITLFIAIAPMLGFMGTVIGMIQAFDDIQVAGDISPNLVAGGMKVALITTVGGLIAAIILQIFYNYLISKVDSIVIAMEDASISLVDMLVKYQNK